MTCGKCKGPLSTQDLASYGHRCEDCFIGNRIGTSGQLSPVLRTRSKFLGLTDDKKQKPKHCHIDDTDRQS